MKAPKGVISELVVILPSVLVTAGIYGGKAKLQDDDDDD